MTVVGGLMREHTTDHASRLLNQGIGVERVMAYA
jgi:hypothetical protein